VKQLYKFGWHFRGGDVEGIFVADSSKVEGTYGEQIYFGEILGKHSEVGGDLKREDMTVLTDDQDFIAKFEQYVGSSFGYNPLENIAEME
jgi:hypothetical protein